MKRWTVVVVTIISVCFSVFAESQGFENKWFVESTEISFSFDSGTFTYHNSQFDSYGIRGIDENIPVTISGAYTIKNISGFIVADVDFVPRSHRLFVFYENRNIIIYDTEIKRTFYGSENAKSEAYIFPVDWVEATSYYTEILNGKEINYMPDNLAHRNISIPWVEGVKGKGEGEVLRIGSYPLNGTRYLLILNGFFSPNQPGLYWENGRLKKIKLKGFDNNGDLIYEGIKELQDKPSLQLLTTVISVVEFEIEILEVFPGTKFSDTAISGLFFDELRNIDEQRDY